MLQSPNPQINNKIKKERLAVSALILSLNEEQMIVNCIKNLFWCQEIILLDTGSSDKTVALARELGVKVYQTQETSFAKNRNFLLEKATQDVILYIDPDERIDPSLFREIKSALSSSYSAHKPLVGVFKRKNIFFGKEMVAGGWQNDYVTRLFSKVILRNWSGDIHESANYTQDNTYKIVFDHELWHLTHRNVRDGLLKSANWTLVEAQLIASSQIKNKNKITVFTIIRKTLMEFIRRFFLQKGYRDKSVGFIESATQAFNKFLVYTQVWQLQHQPPIESVYNSIDNKIQQEFITNNLKKTDS